MQIGTFKNEGIFSLLEAFKMKKTKIEKTEQLVSNSKIGTMILTLVDLHEKDEKNKPFTYGHIYLRVLPDDKKQNNSLIYPSLKRIINGLEIKYRNYQKNLKGKTIYLLKKTKGNTKREIYTLNKDECINLIIQSLCSLNYKYANSDYKKILQDEIVRNNFYDYLKFLAKEKTINWNEDLYSISDFLANLENDLIVAYFSDKNKNCLSPILRKLAKKMIEESQDSNFFLEKERSKK